MRVRVRPAVVADVAVLLELAEEAGEAARWTETQMLTVLERADAGEGAMAWCAVDEVSGVVAGFVVAGWAGGAGEPAEMENLAVRLEARRKGVGRALCKAVVQWADEQGAAGVLLEVRSRNAAARAMYEGLGWRQVGMRQGYYRDPADDALVLWRDGGAR